VTYGGNVGEKCERREREKSEGQWGGSSDGNGEKKERVKGLKRVREGRVKRDGKGEREGEEGEREKKNKGGGEGNGA
jgi:hypothetical protein